MPGNRERGATFWSVLFVVILVGFFVFLAFEIFPPYLDNWQIAHALGSVAKRPEINTMSNSDLRSAVRREFNVGYVSGVSVANDLQILPTRTGGRILVFTYNVRVPIIYNITAVIHFVDRRKVRGS